MVCRDISSEVGGREVGKGRGGWRRWGKGSVIVQKHAELCA